MAETQPNDVAKIVDLAVASVGAQKLDSGGALIGVVVPQQGAFEIHDLHRHLDKYLPVPDRLTGDVRVQKVEDLVRYVKRFDDAEVTTIWLDAKNHTVVAVLNDHGKDDPQWGDHRATLKLEHTPEWAHWLSLDGKLVSQEAFATHIEEGLNEIVQPDGATLLEIAQSVSGTADATWKSAHRLADGAVHFQYVEEVNASAGTTGDLEIPKIFALSIPPFIGEAPAPINARFRYRIHAGALSLGYVLERPWQVEREAVDRVAVELSTTFAGDRVFIGSPRA